MMLAAPRTLRCEDPHARERAPVITDVLNYSRIGPRLCGWGASVAPKEGGLLSVVTLSSYTLCAGGNFEL